MFFLFYLLLCSGRNTGLFWWIIAWDTTRTLLQKRWLLFLLLHLNVEKLYLFLFWPCFAGFQPGWWDWSVDLLQCDRVSSPTQLRLPNTCELLQFLSSLFFFQHSSISLIGNLPAFLCNRSLASSFNWTMFSAEKKYSCMLKHGEA